MSSTTVAPPVAAGQSRCLTVIEASRILRGTYPLERLDARLDHVDGCARCTSLFATVVALVVAYQERMEAKAS